VLAVGTMNRTRSHPTIPDSARMALAVAASNSDPFFGPLVRQLQAGGPPQPISRIQLEWTIRAIDSESLSTMDGKTPRVKLMT
jgi:hypothetical protein